MSERRVFAYYKGCSLEGTAIAYDASLRLIMEKLGVDLEEPPDWSCCGSSPAHAVDHLLAAALAARNLSIIERTGNLTAAVPCPSCFSALSKAHSRMLRNKVFKDEVNELLDSPYHCTVTAKSALQLIYEDIGLEELAKPVTTELPDLKIAPYYGCIFNRPHNIVSFDDPENPVYMDNILRSVGMTVVDFEYKMECCGAAFGLPKRDTVLHLAANILNMALDAGANCISVPCPMCQQNLDLRQSQINAAMGTSFNIPVLYFSQIIGLAYGFSPKELGIDKNMVSAESLIQSRRPVGGRQNGTAAG